MAIDVSVQHKGRLLPIYTVHPVGLPSRNPFKHHVEVLYLQAMITPKCFDIFSPYWGMLRRSRCVHIYF